MLIISIAAADKRKNERRKGCVVERHTERILPYFQLLSHQVNTHLLFPIPFERLFRCFPFVKAHR